MNWIVTTAISFVSTLFLSVQTSWSQEPQISEVLTNPVSIDCQYQLVHDVLFDISQQSGLIIHHEQLLNFEPLFPFNDNLEALDAVVRLLRGHNTIIEFNRTQNNINIQIVDLLESIN